MKMGMVAFYAGLCVGMLLGFLLLSLWAFFLAKPEVKALPREDLVEQGHGVANE
jgi:hypothetical protein